MSQQRECAIVGLHKDEWYLLISMHEYGRLEDNDANCYGSFLTEKAAEDYIDNFSNPGGWSVYRPTDRKPDSFKRLIKKATKPNRNYNWW